MKRRIVQEPQQLIDMKTGEVVNVILFAPQSEDKDFSKVFKACSTNVIKLVKEKRLSFPTLLVLFYMIDNLKLNETKIQMFASDVAQITGLAEVTAWRAIRELKLAGFISQERKRQLTYEINPKYMFKGSVKQYMKSELSKNVATMPKPLEPEPILPLGENSGDSAAV